MHKTVGEANEKKIAILFHDNGLGDAIYSLPGIWQKVHDGYSVDLYARDTCKDVFQRAGANVINGEHLKGKLGTIEKLQKEYGAIYSADQLCLVHEQRSHGCITRTRFEQFADAIETTVPRDFDFLEFFDISGERRKDKVVFSPYSTSRSRRYGMDLEFSNYYWAAYNEQAVDYPLEMIGLFMQPEMPFRDLVELVYHARAVIAIDNGVLHLAMALGTPVIALMGGSDEWSVLHQYRRFGRMDYLVLRSGVMNAQCRRPCSFQVERGYGGDKQKCTKLGSLSDCMNELEPEKIFETLQLFIRST